MTSTKSDSIAAGCGLVVAVPVSGKMMAAHYEYTTSRSTTSNTRADSAARVTRSAGDSAPGARGTVCLGSSFPFKFEY